MQKIKNNAISIEPEDAIINENYIIPGLNGLEPNYLLSYYNMQKDNEFNITKMAYKQIRPNISINDYPNLIIGRGNFHKNGVAIIINNNEDIKKWSQKNDINISLLHDLQQKKICFEYNQNNNCSIIIKCISLNNNDFFKYEVNSGDILLLEDDLSLENFKYLIKKIKYYNLDVLFLENLISEKRG